VVFCPPEEKKGVIEDDEDDFDRGYFVDFCWSGMGSKQAGT